MARKEKCWRIRLETGLARKRSQKFYKLIGIEPFALSLMMLCCRLPKIIVAEWDQGLDDAPI